MVAVSSLRTLDFGKPTEVKLEKVTVFLETLNKARFHRYFMAILQFQLQNLAYCTSMSFFSL
jgi:hypothetical protein